MPLWHRLPMPRNFYRTSIDDIDLRDMDMSTMPNYALDLIANDGMFIETQDGKYKAYIYVNSVRTGRVGATISMKRYTMY